MNKKLIIYGGALYLALYIFRQAASAKAQKSISAAQASRL
jgi:hypothetical protein